MSIDNMSIDKWVENELESGHLDPNQVIAVYGKNNNLAWLGKAEFLPLIFRFEKFHHAEMIGHELRINERQ